MNLYKYVSSGLWENILRGKSLRFTQAPLLNDPFELQIVYESIANTQQFKDELTQDNVEILLASQLKNALQEFPPEFQALISPGYLEEFAKALSPIATEEAPSIVDNFIMPGLRSGLNSGFGEHLGILSLTEDRNNLLMWAHYAENHKGLVIGFDSEAEFFHQQRSPDDELRHVRKVQYNKIRPAIQLASLTDMAEMFLTKSVEWVYEQEWRMMQAVCDASQSIQKNGETICLFSFPPKIVTEVILGCRMQDAVREKVLEYMKNNAQYSQVKIYDGRLDEREFKLKILPFDL